MGALSYFLRSWSLLFVIFLFTVLNVLYQYDVIDPRNKAYGLDYTKKDRPEYSLKNLESLNTPEKLQADKNNMVYILNRWKRNQREEKPLMVLFNFSGGGVRSAAFSMSVLQELDSITGGAIMKKTTLMTGASGGMLAAAYFRELYRLRLNGARSDLLNKKYLDNISDQDILNYNIPTGIPLVYELGDNLKPLRNYYLGNLAEIEKAMSDVTNQAKANA